MRRFLLTTACILLLPALASATTFTASLAGDAGSGFGTIDISGNDIDYSILVSGFAPTTAILIFFMAGILRRSPKRGQEPLPI